MPSQKIKEDIDHFADKDKFRRATICSVLGDAHLQGLKTHPRLVLDPWPGRNDETPAKFNSHPTFPSLPYLLMQSFLALTTGQAGMLSHPFMVGIRWPMLPPISAFGSSKPIAAVDISPVS